MPRALAPRTGARASELAAERDREWLKQFAETVRLIERGHKLTRAEAERHTVLLDPAPHGPGVLTLPRKATKARRAETAPAESERDSSALVFRQARKRQRPRLTITADHFDDDDFE
ncbi:hypothetical protein [Plantibacter sp. ME-Dv--P-095]|uniref:hypothetical protein n=1 Tax=Plantibacter sp. ME-Dv--P-095 TaxID=3040299 RepID=UPI002551474E|nr:hypothetical protein [Plantibacter sp. ME-Dv--P-095]